MKNWNKTHVNGMTGKKLSLAAKIKAFRTKFERRYYPLKFDKFNFNNYFSIEFPDNYRKQKKVRHALVIKYLKENNYSL